MKSMSWIDLLFILVALGILAWVAYTIIVGIYHKKAKDANILLKSDIPFHNWQLIVGITWCLLAFFSFTYYMQSWKLHDFAMIIINGTVSVMYIWIGTIKWQITEDGIFSSDGFWKWDEIISYQVADGKKNAILFKIVDRIFFINFSRTIELDIQPYQNDMASDLLKKYLGKCKCG